MYLCYKLNETSDDANDIRIITRVSPLDIRYL